MIITVLIADDHQLFRQGLVNMLGDVDHIEVLAEAKNGSEAVDLVGKLNPNVVLMDIAMPEMSGVEATRYIHNHYPDTKVIALTMHSDRHFIKAMLEEGAHGYLFKNCTYTELVESIMQVSQGKKYLDSEATGILMDSFLGQDEQQALDETLSKLSEREFEILKLYAEGKSTKEIADQLFISVKTVGTHKQNVQDKLNLHSTTDMVKYALKMGIIRL